MPTYIKSPINYMGSKFPLMGSLINKFPSNPNLTFVDLFTGGGSVYMNVAQLYNRVIANDRLSPIMDIHAHLGDNEYIERASSRSIATKHDKQAYLDLRDEYNSTGDSSLLLALIWSCNSNMMRFNKSLEFNQTHGKRGFNKNTERNLQRLAGMDLSNVEFTSKCFTNVEVDASCFVYIDPPYSNTEAGYNALWSTEQENMLIAYCQQLQNKGIYFGISGVLNGKPNRVFNELSKELHVTYLGDYYQKISKTSKVNTEYYMTNYKGDTI